MQDILAQVFSYIWGVWRHRWLALGVAWVVAIAGWIWVWQLPESYVASARVYVDTNTMLRPLLQGLTIQPDLEDRIGFLSRTLLSRPNLEKLMRMTDLDLQVTTAREKEELLAKLSSSIGLQGGQKDKSLYAISVRDPDRDNAKRIAQALITIFIETSLAGKREDSTGAHGFVDEKIKEYEQRMIDAETAMAAFQQKHIKLLGGQKGFYANLNNERTRLKQARLMLKEEENRKAELERQLEGEDPLYLPPQSSMPGVRRPAGSAAASSIPLIPGKPSPLDARIASINSQLDDLSLKYTDRHPQVRQLVGLLDELEQQRAAELAEYRRLMEEEARTRAAARKRSQDVAANRPPVNPYDRLVDSPVYQGVRKMLADTNARIASREVRVKEYERQVAQLESQADIIPEIEGQLKQLDRDYSIIKSQHATLLRKREMARLGEDVEQKAGEVTFRVIDPPYVPLRPSEPNKALFSGVVLLAGLAAGVGVSLLVSLVYPVIFDARTLLAVTGLPVLGTVSINLHTEERRRERYALVAFGSLTVTLLLVYLVMMLGQSGLLWS